MELTYLQAQEEQKHTHTCTHNLAEPSSSCVICLISSKTVEVEKLRFQRGALIRLEQTRFQASASSVCFDRSSGSVVSPGGTASGGGGATPPR